MSEGLEGCRMLMEHPEQLPQDSCQQGVFMEVGGGGIQEQQAGCHVEELKEQQS